MFEFFCKTFSESKSCDVTVCPGLLGVEVISFFTSFPNTCKHPTERCRRLHGGPAQEITGSAASLCV